MDVTPWLAVDRYFADQLLPQDAALDAALAASAAAGLPAIQVSALQGKLLQLMAMLMGARNILEVGTLGGYSAIWLARALPPGGRLVTLEIDPNHARVALANLAHAGLADRVELRLGPAADSLAQLVEQGAGPFDLVFIDADKPGNTGYFDRALELSRPGTAIVIDNVVRNGAVLDPHGDANVAGARRVIERLAGHRRVTATVIQTVGAKGYDGFALARVIE